MSNIGFGSQSGGGGGGGDVTGPGSSTDNAFARFDGTTGKVIQNSVVIADDSGNVTGMNSLTLGTPLAVGSGGTGNTTLTDGGILLGSGTAAVTATSQPTDGQLLIGVTGSDPSLGTLTQPAAGLTITGGAGTVTFALADDLAGIEALMGNGVVTRTSSNTYATNTIADRSIVVGDAGNTLQGIGPLSDGQLVIGSTGAAPVAATLTGGTGITVSNGAGSITIDADNVGDVVGPVSATDEALVRFDGTTGKLVQNSVGVLTDAGALSGLTTLTMSGNIVMGDNSVTGVDTITFTDTAGTIAGIQNQNLVDKTASETITGSWDFGGAGSLEIPNSATPTVNADGEIAIDTTVTDFSTGIMKYYGGEEMGVVAMPIAQFTSPTDGYVVAYNATNDEFELVAQSGGGGAGTDVVKFEAKALDAVETNSATLEQLTGTNVTRLVRAFDDTTEEYGNGSFIVHPDIDTTGNVTIRLYVMSATAVSSRNTAWTWGYVARNDGEDFDVAYTDVDSGDQAMNNTQDNLTEITFTVAASNFAAGDMVMFRLSRTTASANDLSGDCYLFQMSIEVPLA